MSLTTRCPNCHTLFRVVQDQLRISEGWARCGQCSEIFDAATALVDANASGDTAQVAGSSPKASTKPQSGAAVDPAPDAPEFATPVPESVARAAATTQLGAAGSEPLELRSVDHVDIPLDEPVDLSARSLPQSTVSGALGATPKGLMGEGGALDKAEPPSHPAGTQASNDAPASQVADQSGSKDSKVSARPSFLREMPRRSRWHRAWVRVLLSAIALTLLAALGGQFALQERDRLSAMFPQIRPALTWLCSQAGCTVRALRRIESVVIEGSSFNKTRGDNYRLSLVLKNTSALEIALPALELTLTDAQDRAVIRRVLTPSDLGATNAILRGGGEWSATIALSVRSSGGADRFSGYRVLAFYP